MSSNLTPEQRSMRARLAAQSRWAKEDPTPTVTKARAAFMARFENDVDPDRVLNEAERQRRAESARKAYFTRLALKSSQARRRGSDAA
jgi:hypothetical protein